MAADAGAGSMDEIFAAVLCVNMVGKDAPFISMHLGQEIKLCCGTCIVVVNVHL